MRENCLTKLSDSLPAIVANRDIAGMPKKKPGPSSILQLPTRHETNLVNEALAIEQDAAASVGKVGYMARILAQITLPHSQQTGSEYTRVCGGLSLSLLSPSNVGLPYGSYPRLLLCLLSTEAVRTKSAQISLGNSVCGFIRSLGLSPTGGRWGTIARVHDQMRRLFSSSLTITVDKKLEDGGSYFGVKHVPVVSSSVLCWRPQENVEQDDLFDSKVVLADEFYRQVVERPVPVDMRAIGILSKSPLSLDFYVWLTYRMSYLKKRTIVPWEAILAQFGAGYPATAQGRAHFKSKISSALRKVELVYPALRMNSVRLGLELLPSRPHVARRDR